MPKVITVALIVVLACWLLLAVPYVVVGPDLGAARRGGSEWVGL